MIENLYAPFPLTLHVVFCVFSTLFLIIRFFNKRNVYYILLTVGIDLTILTQFFQNEKLILTLGIIELIILILVIVFMYIASRRRKKEALYDQKLEESWKSVKDVAREKSNYDFFDEF